METLRDPTIPRREERSPHVESSRRPAFHTCQIRTENVSGRCHPYHVGVNNGDHAPEMDVADASSWVKACTVLRDSTISFTCDFSSCLVELL